MILVTGATGNAVHDQHLPMDGAAETGGRGRAPFPDVRVATIDPDDIGAVAAVALRSDGGEGRAYRLSGPESLMLDASDEFVEVITEQLPGGGVVNQVWDVALRPGRFGIKVATTVFRRGRPAERSGVPARGRDAGDGGRDERSGPGAAD